MTTLSTVGSSTVFEVHERGVKRWIKLQVIEPVTITAKDYILGSTSFTTYLLRIETNHYAFSLPYSEVRRRYSEFCWLRSKLANHHPNKVVPPLPSKKFFHMNKFTDHIIEERRLGLGQFLQRVMRSSVLLSDSALHLFLQSNLSTKEIDQKLSEELPPRTVPLSSYNAISKLRHLPRSTSCSSSDGSTSDRSMSEAMNTGFHDVSSSFEEDHHVDDSNDFDMADE